MYYYLIGNTMQAVMSNVRDVDSGELDNNATFQFTIYDKDGSPVGGQTWPELMINVDPGKYVGNIDSDLQVSLNHTYVFEISGVGSGSEQFFERHSIKAIYAGGAC